MRATGRWTGRAAALAAALGLWGCQPGAEPVEPVPAVGANQIPIVGGLAEPGHPAVGALAQVVGGRYNGPFCTATLIAPTWVLTAAHCLEGLRRSGQPAEPANVVFVVGPDARARDNAAPRDGVTHPVAAFHQHPGFIYGSVLQVDDLALYALAEPVADVAPLPLWRQPMEALGPGTELLYVGYGANDGVRRTGTGLKRARTLALTGVFPAHYLTDQPEGGTCYGDSGGPGLLLGDGPPAVVGVNSTVTGTTPAGAQCMELSSQTRVDAYQTWIDRVMGGDAPCAEVPCACDEACADGVCDPLGCDARGCRVLAECLSGCQGAPACVLGCWDGSHRQGHGLYNAVIACGRLHCPQGGDACFNASCATEIAACNGDYDPGPGGDAACSA
ncbi:MAG: trypsin-like serine protease, partial [Myxococcales bacterium]|nr:trypsin-like serine protease [Myxococcales bacterium]